MSKLVHGGLLSAGLLICLSTGCAVPQPAGKGKLTLLREKTTKRHYWLYLPEEYMAQFNRGIRRPVHPTTKNGLWPLVVSFHGMKPFDNCLPQAQEWQQESDRYGFIMIAPQLMTSDLLMQFPLKNADLWYVQGDEKTSLAIIREVLSHMPVDRNRVLSTSWSSGGYLAHYMVNRFPRMFSCLAVRQSNFSADLLDTRRIKYYRTMPIGIFWTQNDFLICQVESRQAVTWYRRHGFTDVSWGVFGGMGHERTPQSAAALFAIQCGIRPRTPAKFRDPVESHGRLNRAMAHALRPAPRPATPVALTNGELANVKVASNIPDRTPRTPKRVRPAAQNSPVRRQAADRTQVADRAQTPARTQVAVRNRPPSTPGPAPTFARTTTPPRSTPRKASTVGTPRPTEDPRAVWKTGGNRTNRGGSTNVSAPYTPVRPAPNYAVTPARKRPAPRRTRTVQDPVAPPPGRAAGASADGTGKPPNPDPVAPDAERSWVGAPRRPVTNDRSQVGNPIRRPARPVQVAGSPRSTGRPPAGRVSRTSPKPLVPTPPSRTPGRGRRTAEPVRWKNHHSTPPGPKGTAGGVPARRKSTAGQVEVRLSRTIGKSPCYVDFKAVLPPGVARGADFLWKVDGIPYCNGQTGDKILDTPGEHRIEVLVITADERELRGDGTVTVLGKTNGRRRPTHPYGRFR